MKTNSIHSRRWQPFAPYLLLALIALAGCVTTQRIVWSPDGKRAAVIGGAGDLYLSDAEGKLSELLLSKVTTVAWFSDSRRLALSRIESRTNWTGLAALLSTEQREALRQEAGNLLKQLQSEDAKTILKKDRQSAERQLFAARLLYLRDEQNAAVKLALKEDFQELSNLNVEISGLFVAQIANDKLSTGPTLAWELGPIMDIRIAPNNAAIAYTAATEDRAHLYVVAIDGAGSSRLVNKAVAVYPDWSPDSKRLVYIKTLNSNSADATFTLGVLTRREVLDDQGKIAVAESEEELAGLMFNDKSRVRCLRDGRILFAAEEWQLPITAKDLPERQQLFALAPEMQSTLTRLIPRGSSESLPHNLSYFEVSPNQKRIAVGGDKSMIAILTLASGDVELVQNNTDTDLKTIPSWRSDTELCYIAIPESNTNQLKAEVVLWQSDKTNVLSRKWPEAVRKGLLD